jgi:hypothetical protein
MQDAQGSDGDEDKGDASDDDGNEPDGGDTKSVPARVLLVSETIQTSVRPSFAMAFPAAATVPTALPTLPNAPVHKGTQQQLGSLSLGQRQGAPPTAPPVTKGKMKTPEKPLRPANR